MLVGSKEWKTQWAERYLDAPAPMTAKCIITEAFQKTGMGADAAKAEAARVIYELALWQFRIVQNEVEG